MNTPSFYVNQMTLQKEMTFQGVKILSYVINYPEFHDNDYQYCLDLINRCYLKRALKYQQYIEDSIYPTAVQQYRMLKEMPAPYEFLEVYELRMQSGCIISISFDRYEFTGGAHGTTRRSSDTWDLKTCRELGLSQLYLCSGSWQDDILKQVISQIQADPSLYFDHYENLAKETFDPSSFYCTPDGIVVYYQQYDIAPYSSGIREFLIPYGGCFLSPVMLCEG